MTNSESLFKLIRSMTMSEKRYFKVFAAAHVINGENAYIKLFNVIEKQKVYDQSLLVKKTRIKNISAYKNYLFKIILKSLISYKSRNSIEIGVQSDVQAAAILREKGLMKENIKVLKKAYETAQKYDMLYEVLKLNHLLRISEHRRELPKRTPLENYLADEKVAIKKLNALSKLTLVNDQLFHQVTYLVDHTSVESQKIYHKILKPVLSLDFNYGIINSVGHFSAMLRYHSAFKNHSKIIELIKGHLQLWNQNEDLKSVYPQQYTTLLEHCCVQLQGMGKVDLLAEVLVEIKKMSEHRMPLSVKQRLIFVHYMFNQGVNLIKNDRIGIKNELIEMEKWYSSEKNNIYVIYKLFLQMQMAWDLFYLGDFKRSIKMSTGMIYENKILNDLNLVNSKFFTALAFLELNKIDSCLMWLNDIEKNHSDKLAEARILQIPLQFIKHELEENGGLVKKNMKKFYSTILKISKEREHLYWAHYQLVEWVRSKSI